MIKTLKNDEVWNFVNQFCLTARRQWQKKDSKIKHNKNNAIDGREKDKAGRNWRRRGSEYRISSFVEAGFTIHVGEEKIIREAVEE